MFRFAVLAAATLFATFGPVNSSALPVSIVQVGTFTTLGPGNTDAGLNPGNKFVIKATYDAAVTPAVTRNIGGYDFRVIDLDGTTNTFELDVPMEGLDAVYHQTEANHFFFGTNNPTPQIIFTPNPQPALPGNFPPVADPMLSLPGAPDLIGYEFEGDFTGSNPAGPTTGNFGELSVSVVGISGADTPSFLAQVARCSDGSCADFAVAALTADQNKVQTTVVHASNLVAEAGADVVFSAGTTTRETDASSQNNNLGNARTDKEDFVTYDWTVVGGGALMGTDKDGSESNVIPVSGPPVDINPPGPHPQRAVENVNKEVSIKDSGLTSTIDTKQWQVDVTEDLTGKTGSDTTGVSYDNTLPIIANASATAQGGGGLLFELDYDDADLLVNAIIGGFEIVGVDILVGMDDKTGFFTDLINNGSQLVDQATLLSEFGLGSKIFKVNVSDRKIVADGLMPVMASFQFEVTGNGGGTVPEPTTGGLMALGAASLVGFFRRRRQGVAGADEQQAEERQ